MHLASEPFDGGWELWPLWPLLVPGCERRDPVDTKDRKRFRFQANSSSVSATIEPTVSMAAIRTMFTFRCPLLSDWKRMSVLVVLIVQVL